MTWLRREVDHLFEDLWPNAHGTKGNNELHTQTFFRNIPLVPSLDVCENENEFKITAEVPGLEEKGIEVEFHKNVLTIKGEKHLEREEKKNNYYIAERSSGSFSRSLQIPASIDESFIQAHVKDGILTIVLPKIPTSKGQTKQIKVKKG